MGCTDDPADSDAIYWSARGVNHISGTFTCCGADAERSNGTCLGAHEPNCRLIASLRSHGHADHEPCGLNCPVGGADGTTHQATIEGFTLCTNEPFTAEERAALGAYFRLLRKARDRERGVVDLDRP